jgi:hypothetical protein
VCPSFISRGHVPARPLAKQTRKECRYCGPTPIVPPAHGRARGIASPPRRSGSDPGKGEPRQALRARGRAAYPTANVAMAEATRSPPRARLRSSGTTPQGDHARPGIGDTASLADAFDLRTLLRGLGLACAIAARGLASADVPRRLRACTGRASARSCCRVERPIPAHHRAFGNAFFHSPPATCTLPLRSLNVGESSFSAASTNSRIARPL